LWGRFIQHRVTIIGIALDSGWIPQWPVGWCRSSGSESEAETAPALSATYAYWNPLNLVREVTYGNGASTFYDYDDAYRVVTIEHRDKDLNTILRLEYTYDARNLPVSIAETDSGGTESLVEFWHDDRGRLIRELRLGRNPYHLKYEYDQGGNRTRKFDIRNNRRVEYDYDVDDPDYYGSRANRLMETTTYDRWNPQQGGDVLSQSWYYYTAGGNVRRVVTLDSAGQILFSPGIDGEEPTIIYSSNCTTEGNVEYTAVRFEYACNASAVTYAAGERWCGDPNNPGAPIEDEEVLWAREFRHDGPWQRYMSRPLSPWHFQNNNVVDTGETMETRYEGNHAFIDLEIGSAVRAFEPGIGRIEPYDPNNWENAMTDYYHTDHNGTVRVITGPNGAPLDLNGSFSGHDMVITAFGEIIVGVSDGSSNRYGFLIPWGFQAHDEMPYLHVGARYYDPSTGKFLQRDPIGIRGGPNVYEYALSIPTYFIDPDGYISSIHVGVATGKITAAEAAELLGYGVAVSVGVVAGQKVVDDTVNMARDKIKKHEERAQKKAKREFKDNEDFREHVHRNYKEDVGRPDLTDEEILDAYREWLELGCPRRG
jgi:RHS repeat-associated protein